MEMKNGKPRRRYQDTEYTNSNPKLFNRVGIIRGFGGWVFPGCLTIAKQLFNWSVSQQPGVIRDFGIISNRCSRGSTRWCHVIFAESGQIRATGLRG